MVPYWEDNLFTVEKGGKYGIFNSKGEQIVEFIYDDITLYNCDGCLSVCKNEKWGLIDKDGNLVVPLEFEATSFMKNGFSEVQISKRKKDFYSISEQKLISTFTNCLFGFSDGLAAIKNKGKWGFIDENGVEVIPCQYKDATGFIDGLARVVLNTDLKCGYIDKQNNTIIPFESDWSHTFDGDSYTVIEIGYSPLWSHNFDGGWANVT